MIRIILSAIVLTLIAPSEADPGTLCFEYGCKFDGVQYKELQNLEIGCFKFTCRDTKWTWLETDPNCVQCYVDRDPNILTFDNFEYRLEGKCNYSLSQDYFCDGYSYSAYYGIYGDFGDCQENSEASCVNITTFKVNDYTVVTVNHALIPLLTINGNNGTAPTTPAVPKDCNGNPYPVFVWTNTHSSLGGSCVFVIGRPFALVACHYGLVIYTSREHSGIAGLCGFYSEEGPEDDWFGRNCNTFNTSDPNDVHPFAESWETADQKDGECINQNKSKNGIICEHFRMACENTIIAALYKCGHPDTSVINFLIESCIADSCSDPGNAVYWQQNAYDSACIYAFLNKMLG